MIRALTAVAAIATVLALALGPAAQGRHQATRTVSVGNDFFSPKRLSVSSGTTVRWRWRSSANTHNVKLSRGPRGTRGFKSKTRDAPYSYTRRLVRRGGYTLVCTIHSGMTQKITVR